MARSVSTTRSAITGLAAWTIGILIFFPILWIIILSFKSEGDAIGTPWHILTSHWTTEAYATVRSARTTSSTS